MKTKEYCINKGCGMPHFHCDCGLKGMKFSSNIPTPVTPKQKARELFDKIYPNSEGGNDAKYKSTLTKKINAIDTCKITVNEILNVLESGSLYIEQAKQGITNDMFWKDVLIEIEEIHSETIPW